MSIIIIKSALLFCDTTKNVSRADMCMIIAAVLFVSYEEESTIPRPDLGILRLNVRAKVDDAEARLIRNGYKREVNRETMPRTLGGDSDEQLPNLVMTAVPSPPKSYGRVVESTDSLKGRPRVLIFVLLVTVDDA